MLIAAFVGLAIAVLSGTALAILYLSRETGAAPAAFWPLRALHGLFAVGGWCGLALALRGPPRGVDQGVASFGAVSAVLLALAALAGVGVLATHLLKRQRAGTLIAIHATVAVTGFVILAAYLLA